MSLVDLAPLVVMTFSFCLNLFGRLFHLLTTAQPFLRLLPCGLLPSPCKVALANVTSALLNAAHAF